MAASILLSQSGKPAGTAGVAREDFDIGVDVTATAQGGPFASHLWSIIDRPIDYDAAVQATTAPSSPTASATVLTPVDVPGTYLLQLLVDSGQGLGATEDDIARITFAAFAAAGAGFGPLSSDPAELPRRRPAFRETLEHNVLDPILTNNARGWAQARDRFDEAFRRMYGGKTWAWARVDLPGGGPAAIGNSTAGRPQAMNVASVTRTGVGVVDVLFTRPMLEANSFMVHFQLLGSAGFVFRTVQAPTGFTANVQDSAGSPADIPFIFAVRQNPFFVQL